MPVAAVACSVTTRSHFSTQKVISSTAESSALPSRVKPFHLLGHASNKL